MILPKKATIPELPSHILISERIKKIHQKLHSYKLIYISSPAGFGKTMLTSSFINCKNQKDTTVWYQFDREDQDTKLLLKNLYHYSET